ncbi:MAG: HlyC/CorC family transporter [Acidobacteria bacterium]|nr:HlyC/CorC family transporter [Acidobacteriota bacterium]
MILLVVYVLIALAFSFLCSILEAVLLSVTPSYIAALEERLPVTGRRLRHLKRDVDRPLAAILSLNTIAHTVGAAGAGAQAAVVFGSTYVGVASAVLTLLILVLSEIIPKTLGALYWRQMAPGAGQLLRGLITIMVPFVWLSMGITRLIARGRPTHVPSREEFTAMADLGRQTGVLAQEESRILKSLFRFQALRAVDVMTPRTVMLALDEAGTAEDAVRNHDTLVFSRIPLYRRDLDHVTGYVLKSDILLASARDQADMPLRNLRRELLTVPEAMSLSRLFEMFLDRREHMALVVDEYGGTAGVVTMEDIVETLLGLEIMDEVDTIEDMQALARSQWAKRMGRSKPGPSS